MRRILSQPRTWIIGLAVLGGGSGLLLARQYLIDGDRSGVVKKQHSSLKTPQLISSNTLLVQQSTADFLGIRATPARQARGVNLPSFAGSLALDATALARVRARFSGEVVEIGLTAGSGAPTIEWLPLPWWVDPVCACARLRPLKFGDRVAKGQLLAVVWNKDLGEKKSDLVDAICKYRRDKETLERLESVGTSVVPAIRLVDAKQNLEASANNIQRAKRTLQAWRLDVDEIRGIEKEAERLHRQRALSDLGLDPNWARVEVRAPIAGTIMEKNVMRDEIVDTATDLFKIADLERLMVYVHVYEEDLPKLLSLPRPIPWTIHLKTDSQAPPLAGVIEHIHQVIDPVQRTVLVQGTVENRAGRYRAGQYVTATVALPDPDDLVEVPTSALMENGEESAVFIQPDSSKAIYTLRRVAVVRRFRDVAQLRSKLVDAGSRERAEPVARGELVVVSGALELHGTLDRLQPSQR